MPGWHEILKAQKSASTVLVLFVPSVDRFEELIDQEYWVMEALAVWVVFLEVQLRFRRDVASGEMMNGAGNSSLMHR